MARIKTGTQRKNCRFLCGALLLCAVSAFFGCKNVLTVTDERLSQEMPSSSQGEKLYTVSGSVASKGAVPSALIAGNTGGARSAQPETVFTAVSYKITATDTADSSKTKSVTVTGSSFEIALSAGTYSIDVQGLNEGGNTVLQGRYNGTVTIDEANPSVTGISITISPVSTGSGTGLVFLPFTIAADSGVKSVKAVWGEGGLDETVYFDVIDGKTYFQSNNMPVGLYAVRFYFYNDTSAQLANAMELYSCTESLYVYQNLTTDAWQRDSSKPYFSETDGKTTFTLTKSVISKRRMFYVDGTNGDSANSGSSVAPLDKVSTAVKKIMLINDGDPSTSFKIYLLSDVTESETSSVSGSSKAYICINPTNTLHLTIESSGNTRTISTNGTNGSVLYIGQNADVTVSNVNIADGNYTGLYSGGGIYNVGTLTVIGGTISNCTAGDCGGGIYNDGMLTMTGGRITGCTATNNGGGIYNGGTLTVTGGALFSCTANGTADTYGGGGIYNNVTNDSVVSTITNCTISSCTAKMTGGGIYNKSGTMKLADVTIIGTGIAGTPDAKNGGAIANADMFTITGGTISQCAAETSGGGIYNSREFVLNNVTISECTAASGNGESIYLYVSSSGSSSKMTLNSSVIESVSGSTGRAVYCSSNGTYTAELCMSGSTKITETTPVYLEDGCAITITGALTENPVATIHSAVYKTNPIVLKDTGGALVASHYGQFKSAHESEQYTIHDDGVLSLPKSGGGVVGEDHSFTFELNETEITASGKQTLTVTAHVTTTNGGNSTTAELPLTNSMLSGVTITVFCGSHEVTEADAPGLVVSVTDGTVTIPAALPNGSYNLEISGTYTCPAGCEKPFSGRPQFTVNRPEIPAGFVKVDGGTVEGKDNTNNYAGVFTAGRTVTLSPFYMCDHEVTQGEWKKAMETQWNQNGVLTNPSLCSAGSAEYAVTFGTEQNNRPVENVTWYDAVYYCNARSEQEGLTKAYDISGIAQAEGHITDATVSLVPNANGYRLPTEAEWEFAARGGDPDAAVWDYTFSGAATASGTAHTSSTNSGMDSVGWYAYNNKDGTTTASSQTGAADGKGTHEVKQRAANALGLYDMSGNVYEWCWDWYGTVTAGTETDPSGSASGSSRVDRGGAWSGGAYYCSVSYRGSISPSSRNSGVGFRVVRSSSK